MSLRRRDALKLMLAGGCSLPLLGGCGSKTSPQQGAEPAKEAGRMPAIFLAHGSPTLLDDERWVAELRNWADAMPRPDAVLMISAHWEQAPVTVGATRTVPLVYDFYGFPERYYELTYPAPGAPELAERVRKLLEPGQPVGNDPERGLDHGAYVPLAAMYPDAGVPVLQVSLPTMDTPELLKLGRGLAPLRDERVLIVGSGFMTHNLGATRPKDGEVAGWAADFDAWVADALVRGDVDALLDYRFAAPGVRIALPTHEHFVPLIVALGASLDRPEAVTFPITGFRSGIFTRRSVQFG